MIVLFHDDSRRDNDVAHHGDGEIGGDIIGANVAQLFLA